MNLEGTTKPQVQHVPEVPRTSQDIPGSPMTHILKYGWPSSSPRFLQRRVYDDVIIIAVEEEEYVTSTSYSPESFTRTINYISCCSDDNAIMCSCFRLAKWP